MYIDLLIVLSYIFLISWMKYMFDSNRKRNIINLKKMELDDKCKDYLLYLKGNIPSSIFALMNGIVTSFVMFIILKLSKQMMNMNNKQIYLICFLIWLVSFASSYKFSNCMIGRNICPDGDCNNFGFEHGILV